MCFSVCMWECHSVLYVAINRFWALRCGPWPEQTNMWTWQQLCVGHRSDGVPGDLACSSGLEGWGGVGPSVIVQTGWQTVEREGWACCRGHVWVTGTQRVAQLQCVPWLRWLAGPFQINECERFPRRMQSLHTSAQPLLPTNTRTPCPSTTPIDLLLPVTGHQRSCVLRKKKQRFYTHSWSIVHVPENNLRRRSPLEKEIQ